MSTADEKARQLCGRLGHESECTGQHEWKIDCRCWRFYFVRDGDKDWRSILDVYQGDIDELTVDHLTAKLEEAKWKQVLQTHSGKLVPFFKEGQFTAASDFREWPQKVGTK